MHTTTMSLTTSLLLVPLAVFAAPHLRSAEEIHVVWSHQRATDTTTMKAVSSDYSKVLAESQSSTLGSGEFTTKPMAMNVDANGLGTLSHGDVTYKVHSDRQRSGGISCTTMYDSEKIFIDCSVPWQSQGQKLRARSVDHHDLRKEMGLEGWPVFIGSPSTSASEPVSTNSRRNADPEARNTTSDDLEKRQCEPWPVERTTLQGDGNPHQNYYHRQTSEPLECGAGSCEVSYESQKTFTVGWSANLSPFEWIDAGFAVEVSMTSGNGYTCAGTAGETVCSWYKIAHTAYTVDNWTTDDICLNNERIESSSIIKSPNARNVGGHHYCVRGPCRSLDDAYWDDTGRAGGP